MPSKTKEKIMVTVSGGRSSAYKAILLKTKLSHKYDFVFSFANTGQEHEETLIFVDKLDKAFNLNIIWIEANVNQSEKKSSGYTIKSFKTASRKGEPFEEVIKKYGLPNQNYPHCTRELKNNPCFALMKDLGISKRTLGIRIDEPKRIKRREEVIYPLVDWFPSTKSDVLHFWRGQDFDLNITEELGNCLTCYKKSENKLLTIAKHHPEYFNFFKRMEEEYSEFKSNSKRYIFRGYRTTNDILTLAKQGFNEFEESKSISPSIFYYMDECPEECGSVAP